MPNLNLPQLNQLPEVLGQTTVAKSLSVTMASDQAIIDVNVHSVYSTLNSTTATLSIGASWTGSSEVVSDYGVINVSCYSNVASSPLGLEFQFSHDNITWYTSDSYTIAAATLKVYSFAPCLKYFRLKYTNDGISQSNFFVETFFRQTYVKPSSHRIGDEITADDDAELTTAQIVGLTTGGGGGYKAVKVNPSGALTVESTISSGTITTITNPVSTKETPDATSTYAPTNSTSTAYEASRVVKASSGTLYSIVGYNSKASSQFIQVHNTTSLPSDTAVPVVMFSVPAQSNFSYSSDKFGRFFSTGITVCNSSTGPTKTIGASDVWFDVQFT